MIHLTTLDALTLEHNLRTKRANRYGWLQADTPVRRKSAQFGAVLNALVALIPGKKSSRQIEPVSTSEAAVSATSQLQGVM